MQPATEGNVKKPSNGKKYQTNALSLGGKTLPVKEGKSITLVNGRGSNTVEK